MDLGRRAFRSPPLAERAQPRLHRGFQIDPVCNLAENSISVFFFRFDRLEYRGIFFQAEDLGPPAQSAIDRDLMMLHLLRGADEGDVAHRRIGRILDHVGGFSRKPADYLAGFRCHFPDMFAEQAFKAGDVAVGLVEVYAERIRSSDW